MKGHNTLILNNETILAALQEYVDKRWKPDGDSLLEVRQVTVEHNHRDHTVKPDFRVEVCEVTPQERAQRVAGAMLGHAHAADSTVPQAKTGPEVRWIERFNSRHDFPKTAELLRIAQEIADRHALGTALVDPRAAFVDPQVTVGPKLLP